jgi:hypothetical protein
VVLAGEESAALVRVVLAAAVAMAAVVGEESAALVEPELLFQFLIGIDTKQS